MASSLQPNILIFKADGVIPKGSALKYGSDNEHVAKATASTDKLVGIAQSASTAAEDQIEVALVGGGAKGLAGGTIAGGDLVTADSNGALIATTTPADRYLGVAMNGAVASDLFAVHLSPGLI